MNIDKIKNYNQKLLAVLGTVVTLIAIFGLFSIIFFIVEEMSRSWNRNNQESGILSDQKIEELQRENKRKQLISYQSPSLVDTLNLIYMIPVSHKTLDGTEPIDDGVLRVMDSYTSTDIDKRYSRKYYGYFNNLLIYNYKTQELNKLFFDRVNFENIQIEYFEDDIILLLKASAKDTFKDGVINQRDYKSLFLYSLKDKKLKQITLKGADTFSFNFVENSKDLLITFGIDQNKDGEFNQYAEPLVNKRFDYESGTLVDIVSKEINAELQRELEGSKK